MTARKAKAEPIKVDPEKLIPVWVHDTGLSGFDMYGNPVEEMEVNQYGHVVRIVAGMQPADTDPMELKTYRAKRTYKTRVMKADVDTVEG